MIDNYLEDVNTLPEQVEINKQDIKNLKNYIKEAYKCNIPLEQEPQSVQLSTTNAPSGTSTGWLLDTNANLFKIVGNETIGNELLILIFYTNITGPQGATGPQGPIGPQGPKGARGYSVFTTTENITIDTLNINLNTITPTISSSDIDSIVIGANGGYARITGFSSNRAEITFLGTLKGEKGDIGLTGTSITGVEEISNEIVGTQTLTTLRIHYSNETHDDIVVYAENGAVSTNKYIHRLKFSLSDKYSTYYYPIAYILNNDNTPFTSETLKNYLIENGFNNYNKVIPTTPLLFVNQTDKLNTLLGITYVNGDTSFSFNYFNFNATIDGNNNISIKVSSGNGAQYATLIEDNVF